MAEKQKLKKQIADAQVLQEETINTIAKQKAELSSNEREIGNLQVKINSFQKRLEEVQKKISEPEVAELRDEFNVLSQPITITVPVQEGSADYRRAAVKNVQFIFFPNYHYPIIKFFHKKGFPTCMELLQKICLG